MGDMYKENIWELYTSTRARKWQVITGIFLLHRATIKPPNYYQLSTISHT